MFNGARLPLLLRIRPLIIPALFICILLSVSMHGQAPTLSDMYARIREEETNNSKIMWIVHEVADVYGPRVTGTPNLKSADDWALRMMALWGLTNTHLESWTFQPSSAANPIGGWENILLQADAVSPFHGQLMVKPLAWTPGTKGVITASAVLITPPGLGGGRRSGAVAVAPAGTPPPMPPRTVPMPVQPTRKELDAYLDSVKSKIRGHIVMVGKHVEVAENFVPAPFRIADDAWRTAFDPSSFNGGRGGGVSRVPPAQLGPDQMTVPQVTQTVGEFLVDNGALARINDGGREDGIIVAQENNTYDSTRVVPTLVMRNEDYGRISRILADGTPVTLRINIENREYPQGKTAYNAIGEIPGTDKKDEIVMLGAHFDSWHVATGATDNGIGSSMMLEAMRILAALHVRPRRTIRVALWSGEEQGLLGSLAYVKQHFGSYEEQKPEFAKFDAYFNIDSGTGKPRGALVFGPQSASDMIRDELMAYQDWGFVSARTTFNRTPSGTDSSSFNNAGLVAVELLQDPFDYGSFTHHTNLDTYEHVYEEDVREGAVEIASAVYALAMADNTVPRFTESDMPKPVPVPGPGSISVPPTHRLGGRGPKSGRGGRGATM